jgi:probable rRNA maturation factor
MHSNIQIEFNGIDKDKHYSDTVQKVLEQCFVVEKLTKYNINVNVMLTNPIEIQKLNREYRNIDKPTDVLSFPMYEKGEFKEQTFLDVPCILGDIVISVEQVQIQSHEYGNTFEREFAYMLVHGFYHLMGYDHIDKNDKEEMRKREEAILKILNLQKDSN